MEKGPLSLQRSPRSLCRSPVSWRWGEVPTLYVWPHSDFLPKKRVWQVGKGHLLVDNLTAHLSLVTKVNPM